MDEQKTHTQKNVLLTSGWCDQLRVGVWLRGGHARRLHQVPNKMAMVTIISTKDRRYALKILTIAFTGRQLTCSGSRHRQELWSNPDDRDLNFYDKILSTFLLEP